MSWFWLGAIWNEIEGAREDRLAEDRIQPNAEEIWSQPVRLRVDCVTETEAIAQATLRYVLAEWDPTSECVLVRGDLITTAQARSQHGPSAQLRIIGTVFSASKLVLGVSETSFLMHDLQNSRHFELFAYCTKDHGRPVRVRLHLQVSTR